MTNKSKAVVIHKNISFAIGETWFDAKMTRYNLNGDKPWVISMRLVQEGKSTIKEVRSYSKFSDALMAYSKGLEALQNTEYNVIINSLMELHVKKISSKIKEDLKEDVRLNAMDIDEVLADMPEWL